MDYFDKKTYFVFTTSTNGQFRSMTANHAAQQYDYIMGTTVPTESCYPLVTRYNDGSPLSERDMLECLDFFFSFAAAKPNATFKVTTCTPYKPEEIGPMFSLAPLNIILPLKYKKHMALIEGRKWWNG